MKKNSFLLCFAVFFIFLLFISHGSCSYADNYSRILDYSDVLSSETENVLSAKASDISNKYSCDVIVVFTDYIHGRSATEEADDFYDKYGYGFGAEKSGILLYIASSGREYAISTSGSAIDAFTDAGLKYITELIIPFLQHNDWSGAANEFISQSEVFLRKAESGTPYDSGNLPKEYFSLKQLLGCTGLGAVFAGLPLIRKKKEMKTVSSRQNAVDYIPPGGFRLTDSKEIFINKSVSRVPVPKDTSSRGGSGGSSVHMSSSGSFHGGTSGKF